MSRAPTPSAEALLLRRWALALFGTDAGPDELAWQRALACSTRGWKLFLARERCAAPLQRRLKETGTLHRLPAPIAAELKDRALYDLKRVLSARSHLATIAALAQERGWWIAVLKGGVPVAEGEQIYLADLDILVEPERTDEIARALAELGFESTGRDLSDRHHIAARAQPHTLPVEIHRFIKEFDGLDEVRARTVPLRELPPLQRFAPADHLRNLLVHSTTQHPERAGRIRDLLLAGHALAGCTPADIATLEADLAGHDELMTIREVIRAADALRSRAWRADPFEFQSLCNYIAAERPPRGELHVHIVAHGLNLAIAERSWWREFLRYRARLSAIDHVPLVAWLRRHVPPLADLAKDVVYLPTFLAAATIARTFRHEAKRVLDSISRISVQPTRSGPPVARERTSRAGSR